MHAHMRSYTHPTGRPVTMGMRHMVATPHYLASAAGNTMFERGGSAVDAIIAANAALCVVYGHMSGLVGDLFAQVWSRDTGEVTALNASGRAGERVAIEQYEAQGLETIPPRGPLGAITVPGAVDGWWQLHQRFGTLDWNVLFEPALRFAEDGFPLSAKYHDYLVRYRTMIREFPGTAAVLLPGGAPPAPGAVVAQPELARSLTLIAEHGADVFYRGELAGRIVQGLQASGGLLTDEDFAAHRSDWVEPLRASYRGCEVTELPPNTQGIAALMIMNILEEHDLPALGHGSADYHHLMVEAIKLAFVDRDRWVTDPDLVEIPTEHLLSKDYARERSAAIDFARAGSPEGTGSGSGGGDTVYLCAADAGGHVVSLIQSIYFEFGSAFMAPGTGILLQNRGSFFSLDPQNVNALKPRKRTFHTIIPAMALRGGRPVLAFGTMGGEGQPQTQAALLTNLVDFEYDVQQAIEAPRWLYGRTWGESSRSLRLEGRVSDVVADELVRRGHDVQMMTDWSQTMGHAQAIWIDHDQGVLHGGADPRGDGSAIGV